MKRLLLSAALAGALLAAAPASHAATIGISDQQARTFESPLFPSLKVKHARYIAPYDVMSDQRQLGLWHSWHAAARAKRQRILISFEHSRTAGKEQKAPSNATFEKAMRAFKKAYPDVKEINSWNEVNRCQTGGRTEGQPRAICRGNGGAKKVAGYYKVARKVFKGAKIIGLNVLDENNPAPAIKFVRAFKRYAKPAPKYWGIHNYSDTNRFSSSRTKRIIRAIGPKGKIWLLETGGIVRLGQSLPYDEARAARAIGCVFHITKTIKRIDRAYLYQFNGAAPGAGFDAGLVDQAGTTKRPGFDIAAKRKARKC